MSANAARALLLSVLCAAVFAASPVQEPGDGVYALLTSASLARHGSFDLDGMAPPAEWPLRVVDGHVRTAAPPGTALLSTPFAVLLAAAPSGVPAVREAWAQRAAASLLMGALAGVLYVLARVFVESRASVWIALGAALGTPIWSTASRGLWSHTWTVLLLAVALLLWVRAEAGRGRAHPVALALLLGAAYLTRPDAIGAIAPLAIHVVVWRPGQRTAFGLAALATAAAIAGVSRAYGDGLFLVPGLGFGVSLADVPLQLAAQLVSPSRGLLWFVPSVVFLAYLLVRYGVPAGTSTLLRVALASAALHTVLQAWNHLWYGGTAYGPRLLTELVPFLVLLGALGLAARHDARRSGPARGELACGVLLVLLAVSVNARGAWSSEAWRWNGSPRSIDVDPARVWDWGRPQMLAGLAAPPPPAQFPLLATGATLDLWSDDATRYLGAGWDAPERAFRWALAPAAEFVFTREGLGPLVLRIRGFPQVRPGAGARVPVELNGRSVATLHLGDASWRWHALVLDEQVLSRRNTLRLRFPDGASPRSFGQGVDDRPLGFAVSAIRVDPFPALPASGVLLLGADDAEAYLDAGWGPAADGYRPVDTAGAVLWFATETPDAAVLRVDVRNGADAGPLRLLLNGQEVAALALRSHTREVHAFAPPRSIVRARNVLHVIPAPRSQVSLRSVALVAFAPYPEDHGIVPAQANDQALLLSGWSAPEPGGAAYRWTEGPEAQLAFSVAHPSRYRALRVKALPFVERGLASQRLLVELNGRALASLVLTSAASAEYPLALSPGMLERNNVLVLGLPDARSPASLTVGEDRRALGVAVFSLRLDE